MSSAFWVSWGFRGVGGARVRNEDTVGYLNFRPATFSPSEAGLPPPSGGVRLKEGPGPPPPVKKRGDGGMRGGRPPGSCSSTAPRWRRRATHIPTLSTSLCASNSDLRGPGDSLPAEATHTAHSAAHPYGSHWGRIPPHPLLCPTSNSVKEKSGPSGLGTGRCHPGHRGGADTYRRCSRRRM